MGALEQGANATEGRWLAIPRTLCFVRNGEDVLLMKRAPYKRVFPNRYNGVGGHIERDEDPLTSVRREILEETGLTVRDVRLRAIYHVDAGSETGILVFAYTAYADSRAVVANDEGSLHWIACEQVTEYDLVDDLYTLLPRMLTMPANAAPLYVHLSYDQADMLQIRFAEEV